MKVFNKIRKSFRNILGKPADYSRHYYYYNISNKYESLNSYLTLLNKCSNVNSIPTNRRIRYSPKIEFGSTIKDVKKEKKYLRYTMHFSQNNTILFYRTMIGGYKTKLEMHFYKKKLFFYNYTFSNVSDNDKRNIISTIQEKYLNGVLPFDCSNQSIIDNYDNHVLVDNGMEFTINYISSKCDFFDYVNDHNLDDDKKQLRRKVFKQKQLYSIL